MVKCLLLLLVPLLPLSVQSSNELNCLAETIYREARGEPYIGKLAVALVTVNRTKSSKFPDTICEVVYQPGQFSWTKSAGKKLKADLESIKIAESVLNNRYNKLEEFDALYFHNKTVNPGWKLKKVATIGNHVFYKP